MFFSRACGFCFSRPIYLHGNIDRYGCYNYRGRYFCRINHVKRMPAVYRLAPCNNPSSFPFLLYLHCHPQCPPQFLQSPPHCKDFPFFLFRIMLQITRTTIPATTIPTTTVPIKNISYFILFIFRLKKPPFGFVVSIF